MKPLAVDLCAGLGGWTEGLLAEGWDVVGFDIERHIYGDQKYPAQLVLQDIRTIDGRQFRGKVSLITASPPCQEFSYMSMPWSRAKQIERALQGKDVFPDGYTGSQTIEELTALFDACIRIAKEAECPIVMENVRGAQKWVGRSHFNYGSFHLWGDVPALMPMTKALPKPLPKLGAAQSPGKMWSERPGGNVAAHRESSGIKAPGMNWSDQSKHGQDFTRLAGQHAGVKVESKEGRQTDIGKGARFTSRDCGVEGVKQPGISGPRNNGKGDRWFQDGAAKSGSKSNARKAASAAIAKIPFALAKYIARVYHPKHESDTNNTGPEVCTMDSS